MCIVDFSLIATVNKTKRQCMKYCCQCNAASFPSLKKNSSVAKTKR